MNKPLPAGALERAAAGQFRAYSVLTLKSVDEDQRVIRGVATSPSPDRLGDIVEPLGVKFKNPMPLLHQHKKDAPVGTVKFDKPTKDGITFEATLAKVADPGPLKDRVDTAWGELKAGLVRAVSIGFRCIKYAFMDDGGIQFQESEVLELSLVTIPANADAVINEIRSIDESQLAASGMKQRADNRPVRPGVSGKAATPKPKTKEPGSMAKKTVAEQIRAFEEMRVQKSTRMDEIMDAAADEGVTLDAQQKEEYDTVERECKEIGEHLTRLRAREKTALATATTVAGETVEDAAHSRDGNRVTVTIKTAKLEKGIAFVRMVGVLAQARGNRFEASQIAAQRWHDSCPQIESVLKMPMDLIERAAVAPGTTTDPNFASALAQYTNLATEFIEFLRPLTILGRIVGFRRVPFMIKVPRQTAGAAVNWVGETKVKPLSPLAFDSVTLNFSKVAGIVPLSEELVRFSSPSAEMLVRDDLGAAIAQFLDQQFLDPSVPGSINSPASITNNVNGTPASGTTAAALRLDVKTMMTALAAANKQIGAGGHWVMTQSQALSISLMMNGIGYPEFPNINANGGTFLGYPVVTSENLTPTPVTGGNPIVFVLPNEVFMADDDQVAIDISREASLQMDSAPTDPPVGNTTMVSLWQQNLIAIKAERFINWKPRRTGASGQCCGYITGAKYAE